MSNLIDGFNMDEFRLYVQKTVEKKHRDQLRVKKLYHDDESFNQLILKIVEKDNKILSQMIIEKQTPSSSWRILNTLMDIVFSEGLEHIELDDLTRHFPSSMYKYRGWTFGITHGQGSIISIFNPNDELIYRF
jgi:hypothetical protein